MKLYKLSVTVFSTLLLGACGGGGSDSASNEGSHTNPPPSNPAQQWETIRIDYRSSSSNQWDNLDLVGSKFTFIDGKAYATFEEDDDNDENELYLTQEGEYQTFGPMHSRYGALMGDITVSNTQFKLRPYSAIGSKGLEFTTTVRQRNIANESVLAVVEPDLNWGLNYPQYNPNYTDQIKAKLTAYQALKFPAGSVCLQETEYSNNQEYLMLDGEKEEYKANFNQYKTEFSEQKQNERHYFEFTRFNNAIAYLYSHEGDEANANSGYVKYQDLYYLGYKEAAGVESNLADYIQQYKDRLNQSNMTAEETAARLVYAESLNQGCDFYNPVAANFLKQNLKF